MNEEPYHTELQHGAVLDRAYRIVRLVAQGGMGAIYEAEQLRLARRVALKILAVDPKKSGEFLPRFRREAEICAKLSHPNIVAVLDWNVSHGMPYMVMEYLEGEDLGVRLTRGPIALDAALEIAKDIGSGLSAAHAHGVVHRDLKPSNVYLCNVGAERPHVKLLDFGVSKVAWETTLSTTSPKVLGSPRYMAPEQARGESNIDARVDQFALGVVLYEMLSGKFAFDGESLTTVLYRVVHEPAAPLATVAPHLPPHVIASIERAMAKPPRERFQDVAQFVAALRGEVPPDAAHRADADAQRTIALTPDRSEKQGQQGQEKRPKGRMVAIAGVAAAVLALGVALWRLAPMIDPATDDPAPTIENRAPTTENRAPTTENQTPTTDNRIPTSDIRTPTADVRTPTTDNRTPSNARQPPTETAQVRQLLDDAQQRLDAGEYDEAIRRSRQSLSYQDAPRARLIIALAYCNIGSLGDARAAMFSVRGEDKPAVQRACQARGLSL